MVTQEIFRDDMGNFTIDLLLSYSRALFLIFLGIEIVLWLCRSIFLLFWICVLKYLETKCHDACVFFFSEPFQSNTRVHLCTYI